MKTYDVRGMVSSTYLQSAYVQLTYFCLTQLPLRMCDRGKGSYNDVGRCSQQNLSTVRTIFASLLEKIDSERRFRQYMQCYSCIQ